jgi:hypothetical protein
MPSPHAARPPAPRSRHVAHAFNTNYMIPLGTKDSQGRPIILFKWRNYWPAQLGHTGQLTLFVYLMERAIESMGPGVCEVAVVMDYAGWTSEQRSSESAKMLLACVQEQYPLRVGAVYIVRAPVSFRILWTMVRPMTSKFMQKRVRIIKATESVLSVGNIPMEALGPEFGGTLALDQQAFLTARLAAEEGGTIEALMDVATSGQGALDRTINDAIIHGLKFNEAWMAHATTASSALKAGPMKKKCSLGMFKDRFIVVCKGANQGGGTLYYYESDKPTTMPYSVFALATAKLDAGPVDGKAHSFTVTELGSPAEHFVASSAEDHAAWIAVLSPLCAPAGQFAAPL